MKMLKNEREVDAFATSRTPIPSPLCTKRVVALRYAARLPEPPARGFPSIVPKCVVNVDTRWDANANAGRHDDDPPNDDGV